LPVSRTTRTAPSRKSGSYFRRFSFAGIATPYRDASTKRGDGHSHKESDKKVKRGHITKQGNHLVRWAALEVVARYRGGDPVSPTYHRVAKRRGAMIARVAAARKVLILVFYGLRDGHIRCLAEEAA
jgi:hypothetical protein